MFRIKQECLGLTSQNYKYSFYSNLDWLSQFCFVELSKQKHTTMAHNNKCPSFLPSYQDFFRKISHVSSTKTFCSNSTINVTFLKNQFSNFWTFRFLPLEIFCYGTQYCIFEILGFSTIDCKFPFKCWVVLDIQCYYQLFAKVNRNAFR